MAEITALRAKDITPEMVLTNAMAEKPKHVYLVTFDEDGVASVWASGDLSRMSDAALILMNRATANAMGEVDQ